MSEEKKTTEEQTEATAATEEQKAEEQKAEVQTAEEQQAENQNTEENTEEDNLPQAEDTQAQPETKSEAAEASNLEKAEDVKVEPGPSQDVQTDRTVGSEYAAQFLGADTITQEDTGRNTRKVRIGIVTSDKQQKTITVSVERKVKHPLYGKFIKKTSKFAAHDENEDAGIGDTVRIMETRPLSKRKRWRLVDVLERAK